MDRNGSGPQLEGLIWFPLNDADLEADDPISQQVQLRSRQEHRREQGSGQRDEEYLGMSVHGAKDLLRFLSIVLIAAAALQLLGGIAAGRVTTNGPIVFSFGNPRFRALLSISGTGKHPTLITQGHDDYSPAVSPDGRQIVFVRNGDFHGDQLFTSRVDGSGVRRLTRGYGQDSGPTFSPDGRTIAFARSDGVATMTRTGGDLTFLTTDFGPSFLPAYTPDGERIVFVSTRSGNFDLYSMKSDGTDFVQITNDPGADFGPAVSPSGEKIAFTSDRSGQLQIYTVNLDGSGLRQLTHGAASAGPVYSPDGRQICFIRDDDLYAASVNGKHLRPIWKRGLVSGLSWGRAALWPMRR